MTAPIPVVSYKDSPFFEMFSGPSNHLEGLQSMVTRYKHDVRQYFVIYMAALLDHESYKHPTLVPTYVGPETYQLYQKLWAEEKANSSSITGRAVIDALLKDMHTASLSADNLHISRIWKMCRDNPNPEVYLWMIYNEMTHKSQELMRSLHHEWCFRVYGAILSYYHTCVFTETCCFGVYISLKPGVIPVVELVTPLPVT